MNAEYVQAACAALCRVISEGAPPPVMISISEDRMTVTPWMPGAPVSALLGWANHMEIRSWSAIVHDPISEHDDRLLTSVYCVGHLDGIPVELIGTAWHELADVDLDVRGRHQPLDPKTVIVEAARESPVDLTPEPTR